MKPVLQALLLADRVYQDRSGKHIIAGTFTKLTFQKGGAKPKVVVVDGQERQLIPGGMQAGSPYVFISLTEIHGTVKCSLRYTSLRQDKPLFQCEISITCDDPLQTAEVVLPLPSLPLVAGVHALELFCGDHLLGSHRIIVEEIKGQDDDSDATEG